MSTRTSTRSSLDDLVDELHARYQDAGGALTVDDIVGQAHGAGALHARAVGTDAAYATLALALVCAGTIPPLPVPAGDAPLSPYQLLQQAIPVLDTVVPLTGTPYAAAFVVLFDQGVRHPLASYASDRDVDRLARTLSELHAAS